MVLFQNINVKAKVEALWRGQIHEGTVRYTGVLVGRSEEWIGVELDSEVSGGNSGLHRGVQYFSCQLGHGIFVHARNIRFVPSKRTMFNSYRTVSASSKIDNTLFGSSVELLDRSCERERGPPCITSRYVEQVLNKDRTIKTNAWANIQGFHKSHLVSNHIRPSTASPQQRNTNTLDNPYKNHFISPSSIPSTHVPKPVLKRMIKQDYFGTTIPRYTSLS